MVKALHIEVPVEERDTTYKILDSIFGLNSTFTILGTHMLLVPIIRPSIPSHKVENIHHLIIKQKQFLDKIYYAKTYEFTEIDYKNPCIGMSVCAMILALTTLDGNATQLFWSVDYDNYEQSFQLSYRKYLDVQARDMIAQLPSLLVYLHGPEALTMMTESAQERAAEAPWNPEEMRAISQEDRDLDAMLSRAKSMHLYTDPDAEDSDVSDDDVDYEQVEIKMNRQATEASLFKKASSNHSVGTLGTKPKTAKQARASDDDNYDDATVSNKSSPNKKQKSRSITTDNDADDNLVKRMYTYFELNNIDVHNLDAHLEASSVTAATAAATASMHDTTIQDYCDNAVDAQDSAVSAPEQDREPAQEMVEPPGPHEGMGEGL